VGFRQYLAIPPLPKERRGRCLPGSGSHVSEDDRRAGFEMIYERIETGWRVNVHLGHRSIEEVL
jgi:hypothetical protein